MTKDLYPTCKIRTFTSQIGLVFAHKCNKIWEIIYYSLAPWHFLNFLPLPHGQVSFRPMFSYFFPSLAAVMDCPPPALVDSNFCGVCPMAPYSPVSSPCSI